MILLYKRQFLTIKNVRFMKGLILIPARYKSSRFPGKPLVTLNGKTMVEWVYKNCFESGLEAFVITDHDEIELTVKKFGGNVVRVNDDVETGSERIALAFDRYFQKKGYTHIINVQGDEPLLKGQEIKKLFETHVHSKFDVMTIVKKRDLNHPDWKNTNVVKVIYNPQNFQALYFSRASIPHDRDQQNLKSWYQHIGIYSYKIDSLLKMVSMPVGQLENVEKLEQLRLLEQGYLYGAVTTELELKGVDHPDDVKIVEGALNEQKE
jgi:3-deoxy-manno-octulosonate cytidylyltransferase (CMP-KDO synthetase)